MTSGGRALLVVGLAGVVAAAALAVPAHSLTAIPGPIAQVATWLLFAAGLTWTVRKQTPLGVLTLVACLGVAGRWITIDTTAAPGWRGIAAYTEVLLIGATGLLVLSCVGPGRLPRWTRGITVVVCLALTLGMARAATYDPFFDPKCWRFCQHNPVVIAPSPTLARVLGTAALLTAAAATALIVITVAASIRHLRRGFAPVAVAGCLVMASYVAILAASDHRAASMLNWVEAFAALTSMSLAAALFLPVLTRYRTFRRVRAFTSMLEGADTGPSFARGLAAALGDPTLQVGYPLGGDSQLVDAAGQPVVLGTTGRVITTLTVDGEVIGIVDHDPSIASSEVLDQFGLSARIVAWNEGLLASLQHRLEELQQSSRRIIEIGDEERQRLERDLHDGAQQQLLALAYGLRRAGQQSVGQEASTFDEALQEARVALAKLRDLAHGIFPAILSESGLEAALRTLAARAECPVVVEFDAGEMRESAERTAYAVADEAIACTQTAETTLRFTQVGENLEIAVDGVTSTPPIGIRDRVRAVGGTISATGNAWKVLLPCAS